MKLTLVIISFILMLAISHVLVGCRLALYVGIGPQKFDKAQFSIEGQEADPNIPPGLIDVGLLK